MTAPGKGRQPRSPKSSEQVAELLLLKKLREYNRIEHFKQSKFYRYANIFNIICFFVYIEVLVCSMGPCKYENHYCNHVRAEYGRKNFGDRIVLKDVIITGMDGQQFEFDVEDNVEPPPNYSAFFVGKDFLLGKMLKGGFKGGRDIYRIHSAGSLLFLSCFVGTIGLILFSFNMNMHPYSLRSLTIINLLTLGGFVLF